MAPTGTLAVGETSWTKWQIALVVGAPVALGLGYWYLKRQPTREKPSQDDDKKSKTKGTTAAMRHDPSLDTADSASANLSAGGDAKSNPQKKAQIFKNTGNTSFKLGSYADAIENYSKAIEICPLENASDLSTFYQNRAAAYEQLKDYEKARDDCTSALNLNPSYVKALHRRSKAYENLGNLELSLEDITAACILENFQSESTLLMADRVLKALGRKHAKEAMLTRKAVMPSKHFIKTYFSSFHEDPVTKIGATNGDSEQAENITVSISGYSRARQAMSEQNYEEVMEACTQEIEAEGAQLAEAQLLRATLSLLQGEHKSAMTDFEAVIDNEKANIKVRVNALIKRASLYMQLEQPALSMQDFNKAAELDPVNSDVYHHRGQVKLLLEDLSQAMEDFERAVTLNPDFPIAYVQKCYTDFRFAYSMRDMDKVKDVTQKFEDAVRRFPKCTEAYTLYAQVLTEQEDYSRADKLYNKASNVEPQNATVLVHRAILHLHWTQNVERAVQLINDALRIDDKCEFAYETLGTIEVQRANLSRAIDLFNKAIPLAKTELEMSHLFALKDAAVAQEVVAKRLGIAMPVAPQLA